MSSGRVCTLNEFSFWSSLERGRPGWHGTELPCLVGCSASPFLLHRRDKHVSPCAKGIGCAAVKVLLDSSCWCSDLPAAAGDSPAFFSWLLPGWADPHLCDAVSMPNN